MFENFLLEIGSEEIPAGYFAPACRGLQESFSKLLADAGLSAVAVITTHTPRRIVLFAEGIPSRQSDRTQEVQGPPARIAFDAEGKPTKAAMGFARANSVPVESLIARLSESGSYVVAVREIPGRRTIEILAQTVPGVIAAIPFPKSMHWDVPRLTGGASSGMFARPIRSLLCLFGSEVVPFELSGLVSGRVSHGHPFLAPGPVEIPKANYEDYRSRLHKKSVIVDQQERKKLIRNQIEFMLAQHGSSFKHEELLDEVTNLVEFPCPLEGSFDPKFLSLPDEVIVTAMTEHQRYFPVRNVEGRLLPRFITVSNRTQEQTDRVRRGNERVLAARLNDAAFFWEEDRRTPLAEKVARLDTVTFQEKLGSYGDRTRRLESLSDYIAQVTGQPEEVRRHVCRAAHLAKADLVTHMVYEFTSLQGIMGMAYALADGEDPEVASAIAEHYRPRSASDAEPETLTGAIVALADKFDALTGCFAAGLIPTGSQDPYGLRRHSQGIIRIIISRGFTISLGGCLAKALSLQPVQPPPERVVDSVMAFLKDRLYQQALEGGAPHELIRAALEPGFDDLADFTRRLESLVALSATADWNRLAVAVERTHNITRDFSVTRDIDESLLVETDEKRLYELYLGVRDRIAELLVRKDYLTLGKLYEETFAQPLHTFFEKVFVNVEDARLRENRLTLLKLINGLYADRVADLSQVPRKE